MFPHARYRAQVVRGVELAVKLGNAPGQGFLPLAEVFLISLYGWGAVFDQFEQFSTHVQHVLKVTPSSLISRFDEYSKCTSAVT